MESAVKSCFVTDAAKTESYLSISHKILIVESINYITSIALRNFGITLLLYENIT